MRPKRWMGRTEFRTWNDCERALVGYGTSSTRAKWRAPRSARASTLEKNLTPPTLLEMAMFHYLANAKHDGLLEIWMSKSPGLVSVRTLTDVPSGRGCG